ncbi:predicted protein [Histoplasma capsulatum var. duboisii H88]|uniref:Predicted protein n=1 Tax=Ajellomyces capsulatus (strain H88) TaxID=544711 RepID=F0UMB5_AJEC8|nr:predicted protein [Histoplasma capsulatum var. duboisii H88]
MSGQLRAAPDTSSAPFVHVRGLHDITGLDPVNSLDLEIPKRWLLYASSSLRFIGSWKHYG